MKGECLETVLAALATACISLLVRAVVGCVGFVASLLWNGVVAMVLSRMVTAAADARER